MRAEGIGDSAEQEHLGSLSLHKSRRRRVDGQPAAAPDRRLYSEGMSARQNVRREPRNKFNRRYKLSRLMDKTAWEGKYKISPSGFTIKQMMTTMKSIYCYGAPATAK